MPFQDTRPADDTAPSDLDAAAESSTAGPDPAKLDRLVTWIGSINVPMFVVAHLPGGRLEFIGSNEAMGQVGGLTSEVLAGKSPAELFPERVSARIEAQYRACLASDQPTTYEQALEIDGHETWWEVTLSRPAGFDGQVILGVALSITRHKQREFAMATEMADLTARFEELQLFSTMAAHDARSPLATVSSIVDLVLEDFVDMGDGKDHLLRMVSSTVDEALTQITATLQRARAMSGQIDLTTSVDLGQLCADIAAMVDPEMALQIAVPAARVCCDTVMVQMGLRNLMANAARHCASRVDVRLSDGPGPEQLTLEVIDDGPGIPQGLGIEDLTRAGHARDGAHGFGLHAISQLVRSRGGTLEVRAPLAPPDPTGARFALSFPGTRLETAEGTRASA